MDLKSDPFTEKYICHSFHFHVSEDIQFLKDWNSFLLKHFFFSTLFFQIKFHFSLLFYCLRNICISSEISLAYRNKISYCDSLKFISAKIFCFLQNYYYCRKRFNCFSDILKLSSAATFLYTKIIFVEAVLFFL